MASQFTIESLNEIEAKWLDGTITDQEAHDYQIWYMQNLGDKITVPASVATSKTEHAEKILQKIWERIHKIENPSIVILVIKI